MNKNYTKIDQSNFSLLIFKHKQMYTNYLQLNKNYLMRVVDSVSVLIELIEVSIHCILYARKIYPEGIFELKKKYNVPVHVRLFFNNCSEFDHMIFQISIYPKLNSYINGTLSAVKSLLKLKKLCKLDVCFYNKIGVAVERFVFNIRNVELELNLSDFS